MSGRSYEMTPEGWRDHILSSLQEAAFSAIKICELERSGFRGFFERNVVIGHMTDELTRLCEQLRNSYDPPIQTRTIRAEAVKDDEVPW
jgi:hypothetical protein